MRIDAHHHLWQFNPIEYDWIDESMSALKKNFLCKELKKTLAENHIDGSIVVQARQTLEETNWLLSLASDCDEIKGVVGWIDLKSETLGYQLTQSKNHKKLVGFRHVLQGETDPNFMLDPKFIAGLKTLAEHDYRYDLLILAHQLPTAIKMLRQVPELKVVIDHIAKPEIKSGQALAQWQSAMNEIASNPNVYCKVSGMVTEADWHQWQYEHFLPYLATVFTAFGDDRIMFGSDWPVCLLAAEYSAVKKILDDFLSSKNDDVKDKIFGLNAAEFYQLN